MSAAGSDTPTDKPFVFADQGEAKRYAPATQRNRIAITDILRGILPDDGTVLEIASGTGEHIIHFAQEFPALNWQPSDMDTNALTSITAWCDDAGATTICPPIQLNAAASDWPIEKADAVLCINMLHISPWDAAIGLMSGASAILPPGGLLYLYGPYLEVDKKTAQSNISFNQSLKARNSEWGIRSLEDVIDLANGFALRLQQRIEMPANNLSLVFRKD